jgi:hypothetical protein
VREYQALFLTVMQENGSMAIAFMRPRLEIHCLPARLHVLCFAYHQPSTYGLDFFNLVDVLQHICLSNPSGHRLLIKGVKVFFSLAILMECRLSRYVLPMGGLSWKFLRKDHSLLCMQDIGYSAKHQCRVADAISLS